MEDSKFSISYVNKNEAMFILGLLYSIPCSHCPDFYNGCVSNTSFQEVASLSEIEFIEKHIDGTENFLCGKLRNIVALSKAEEKEIDKLFEGNFSKRVSLLSKKQVGEDVKYVLISDKEELKENSKIVEEQLVEKISTELEEVNKQNTELVMEMEDKINSQEKKIKSLISINKKLKKSLEKNVS